MEPNFAVRLQELVLDCEQPPELENGAEDIKWGLQGFPEGMLHLTNMTHLTLTCHYGITELPENLSKLNKLEVGGHHILPVSFMDTPAWRLANGAIVCVSRQID